MQGRISTKLVTNATTNYIRLGLGFVLGIIFTWYLVGEVGLAGYGMISLAAGSFGFSMAIERAISGSLIREMAAAIATGREEKIRAAFVSSMVFCAGGSVLVVLISIGFGAIAWMGWLKAPDNVPYIREAFAVLFVGEGLHTAVRLALAPYRSAIVGSQRVALDNALQLVGRIMNLSSCVVALAVFARSEPLHIKLFWFAAIHAIGMSVDVLVAVVLARRLVPGLRLRLSAFDRAEFRSIASTCWHTGQHLLLMDFNPQMISVVINLYFGVAYNGIWQIVIQIAGQARLVAEGALWGIEPMTAHLHEQRRTDAITELMTRTIRYQLAVVIPWIATYMMFMTPILFLWVGNRLEGNPDLVNANISVAEAIGLTAAMAHIYLIAMVLRVTMRGVERGLYGIGAVRSYAWFAKYTAIIAVGLSWLLFWFTDSPIGASIAVLVVHILYFDFIVPRAAVRWLDFPIFRALGRSLPRPLAAGAVLVVVLWWLRSVFLGGADDTAQLTLIELFFVAGIVGVVYAILSYVILLEPSERHRLHEMARNIFRRFRNRSAEQNSPTREESAR